MIVVRFNLRQRLRVLFGQRVFVLLVGEEHQCYVAGQDEKDPIWYENRVESAVR